jgi:2-dehydro-3-deoxy-D-arabinonate dehydratase
MKDAAMRRTVSPGRPIGIREDSRWNVPEPEIGVVLGTGGRIVGYTIGNDVSSRDIEGANPLYLPQAKIYAGACSFGPAVFVPDRGPAPAFHVSLRVTDEWGRIVFEGETSTANMRRTFDDLVSWLVADNPVPAGSVLLTGTGLVPPDDFTLQPGHFVEIHVPEIGTLVNPVARAAELLPKESDR